MDFDLNSVFVERTEFLTTHIEESVLPSQSNVEPLFDIRRFPALSTVTNNTSVFCFLIGFPGAPSAIKISKVCIWIEVLFFSIALLIMNSTSLVFLVWCLRMQRELIFRGKHPQTRRVTSANTPCTWPFAVSQPTNQMRSLLPV